MSSQAVVNHDGGWPGFVSSLSAVPGRRFGVFAAVNSMDLAARMDRRVTLRDGKLLELD